MDQMLIVILNCKIVGFKVVKLKVNWLPLITFESRIWKKYINFQVSGHFAHKCKISGGIW